MGFLKEGLLLIIAEVYMFLVMIGEITKYEPSTETEGSGTWTVKSKLKRSNTKGSLNGFNNSLRLQKRVNRDAVKKELKDKKEGKKRNFLILIKKRKGVRS